mmetsp:Transcript_18607/g.54034  ORF Transcript_18607/g.54034 Transcript_18607/m.54034 type:complete len:87 (-) Transcript_18607:322-582(-)
MQRHLLKLVCPTARTPEGHVEVQATRTSRAKSVQGAKAAAATAAATGHMLLVAAVPHLVKQEKKRSEGLGRNLWGRDRHSECLQLR